MTCGRRGGAKWCSSGGLRADEESSLCEDADEGQREHKLQDVEQPLHQGPQLLSRITNSSSKLPIQHKSFQHRLLLLLLHTVKRERSSPSHPPSLVSSEGKELQNANLQDQVGAELPREKIHRHVQLIKELTEVSLHWNLLPTPGGHD